MFFGEQTGQSFPTVPSDIANALVANGAAKPAARGQKRKRGEAYDSILPGPQFRQNALVGGRSFRAKNQHEGLPTALAEAYANGAKDKNAGAKSGTSLKRSGPPWDTYTGQAYDAGFKLGSGYSPLTSADAVRSLTQRTILVSPEGTDSQGNALALAGFHPSSISKSVSESTYAHQEVFKAQAEVLQARATGAISSNDAADLAIAAVHLFSLAPGEYAVLAKSTPTSKSVIDKHGRLLPEHPNTYEDRRENFKTTLAAKAGTLSPADRLAIHQIVDKYRANVDHSVLPAGVGRRVLGPVIQSDVNAAVTSPLRRPQAASASPPELQLATYAPGSPREPASAAMNSIAEAARPFFL